MVVLALVLATNSHALWATDEIKSADDAVVTEMSPIQVHGSKDSGYAARDTATAAKLEVPIRDVPQSIEVRSRQLLDDLGGAQTSFEVAKTVAGVYNAENGQGDPGRNVPNFIFRGFNNNGSYLKDGHMVNGWMSTVDMANIERVEFLKGPASVLYGGSTYTGDIGGMVNYVSKLPQATRVAVADLTAGSHSFYRGTVDYGRTANENKTVTFRVNGALEQGGSFRDFAKHDSQFIAPALTFNLSQNDTFTLLTEAMRSHEIPGRGLPLNPDAFSVATSKNFIDPGFAKTDIKAQNLAAKYSHTFGNDWQLALDLTQTSSRTDQFSDNLTYNPGSVSTLDGSHWKLSNDQTDMDARISGQADTGPLKHTLLLGYNVVRNRYHADSEFGWSALSLNLTGTALEQIVLPPSGSTAALYATTPADPGTFHWNNDADALYIQDMIAVGQQVKVLLGARHDRYKNVTIFDGSFGASNQDTSSSHTSPRIGITWQPTSKVSLYAVQSEAFSPNDGIVLNGTAPPPELGKLKEIGLKQAFGERLNLNLAYYNLSRKNMSFTDPADLSGIAVLVAGETRSRGFELDLNGQLTDAVRVNVAASIMKGWISQGEPGGTLVVGQQFAGVPRKTLNASGIYSFGEDRAWEIGGGVFYAEQTYADSANTFKVPSVIQFDALGSYRFDKKTRMQVNVKNLTNRNNYTSNGWGWINPGEPTSVFATVKHEF